MNEDSQEQAEIEPELAIEKELTDEERRRERLCLHCEAGSGQRGGGVVARQKRIGTFGNCSHHLLHRDLCAIARGCDGMTSLDFHGPELA